MNNRPFWALLVYAITALPITILIACGGGGGGGTSGNSVPEAPAPVPNEAPIASAGSDFEAQEGLQVTLDGSGSSDTDGSISTFSWSQLDNGAPGVTIDGSDTARPILTLPSVDADTEFEFELVVTDDAGDTAVDSVKVTGFNTLPDWNTHQGNASHNGYVPMRAYTYEFQKLWEWQKPDFGTARYQEFISPAVATGGIVYVTEDDSDNFLSIYALEENTGNILWDYEVEASRVWQPAIGGGKLVVVIAGYGGPEVWLFDRETGDVLSRTPFSGQFPWGMSPTILDQVAYVAVGYYGGEVAAFSLADGTLQWNTSAYGDDLMFTPAVNADYVYHYNGDALIALNRQDGTEAFVIPDPDPDSTYFTMFNAPAFTGTGNVVSFNGSNLAGYISNSVEPFDERPLVSFDVVGGSVAWTSTSNYLTYPAIAHDKVFAAANVPLRLEALNASDGTVDWTWQPGNPDVSSFHRNIVVTDDLLFVSSNIAVHAISLDTREEVWSYPEPGILTITPGKTLLIATGARESDGRIVAVSLRNDQR